MILHKNCESIFQFSFEKCDIQIFHDVIDLMKIGSLILFNSLENYFFLKNV
jgi:hypothetical protein